MTNRLLTRLNALEAAAQTAGTKVYLVWDALDPDVYHNTLTGEDLTGAQAKQLQSAGADVVIIRITYDESGPPADA